MADERIPIRDTSETGTDLLRLSEGGLYNSGLDQWDNCRGKAEEEGQRMTVAGANVQNGTEILPEKAAAFWMNGQIRRIRAGAVMPAVKA